jgi:hypothetical protein
MVVGTDGAKPCACASVPSKRWSSSPLITTSLLWELPEPRRKAIEIFLERGPGNPSPGTVIWMDGGQRVPAAGEAAESYVGYGLARLCADRVQAAGMRIRRVTSLGLLDEWRLGTNWFEDGGAIFLDRPEHALPTWDLRQAIELLLSSAWDWEGVLIIGSELAPHPMSSSRPTWRGFVERALANLDAPAWSTLREGLFEDPACPMLGEVCPLMLDSRLSRLLDQTGPLAYRPDEPDGAIQSNCGLAVAIPHSPDDSRDDGAEREATCPRARAAARSASNALVLRSVRARHSACSAMIDASSSSSAGVIASRVSSTQRSSFSMWASISARSRTA